MPSCPKTFRRREVLKLGASTLCYFAYWKDAHADPEFPIETSPQADNKSPAATPQSPANETFPGRPTSETADPSDVGSPAVEDQIGSAFRAPTCGLQKIDSVLLRATGTPAKPPDTLSVPATSYAADNPSRKFLSDGESPIASAWRANVGAEKKFTRGQFRTDTNYQIDHALSNDTGATLNILASVEWGKLGSATVEKAIELVQSTVVDKLARHVLQLAESPATKAASIAIDLLTPTVLQEEPWTYEDSLSPSERIEYRREWFEQLSHPDFPKTMPGGGATIHVPYGGQNI
ncbi:MAG: hypothetical protein J0H91_20820 [Rhodospirillales bacterium]|nr:hypothetical protein [Rhodospirillales bacterium]